jgi:hypothetical protein
VPRLIPEELVSHQPGTTHQKGRAWEVRVAIKPQQIFNSVEAAEYIGITYGHLFELLCDGSLKGAIYVEDLDDTLPIDRSAVSESMAVGSQFFRQDTFICKARGEVKFNSPVLLELKNIMFSVDDLKALVSTAQRAKELNSPLSPEHFIPNDGDDYSSVLWNGKTFHFSPEQARVVRVLHKAFKDGMPEMHQDRIASALSYSGIFRIEKIFRRGNEPHPAFNSLIKKVGPATYRLAI